jgi:hypothetical protein
MATEIFKVINEIPDKEIKQEAAKVFKNILDCSNLDSITPQSNSIDTTNPTSSNVLSGS